MSTRVRAFSSYIKERYPEEGQSDYDEILTIKQFCDYLKYAEAKMIRLRYYSEKSDWFQIQLLD